MYAIRSYYATAPEAAATEAAVEATEAPVKVDFSQNQNVARASDAAKTTIELPVVGIGSTITTDVKAAGDYTICVMTKNSTNPYMNGMWKGAEKAVV